MEYFQHGDLYKCILHSGPCTEREAKVITIQLLEGLETMHKLGYTHRDLKPHVSHAYKSIPNQALARKSDIRGYRIFLSLNALQNGWSR
jgi:calcium/calmodulin-dependent protein kinase I